MRIGSLVAGRILFSQEARGIAIEVDKVMGLNRL